MTIKIVLVIPAYNSIKTLATTYSEIPKNFVDEVILVDDGSLDDTACEARRLGMRVVCHHENLGYGAAQKTGYKEALKLGADIVVLLHSDHQYDSRLVPRFVEMIASKQADVVTGTRMLDKNIFNDEMPLWKHFFNKVLTKSENYVFKTNVSDYHNGFRAYSKKFLESVPLDFLSNKFEFDTEMIVLAQVANFRIQEISHKARYRKENSQMSFMVGITYGLKILLLMIKFKLHVWQFWEYKSFNLLQRNKE